MFKSQIELKEFILWAKGQKIKRVRVGDIEVEISDLAFIEELSAPLSQEAPKEVIEKPQDAQSKEDDDLFWSVSN